MKYIWTSALLLAAGLAVAQEHFVLTDLESARLEALKNKHELFLTQAQSIDLQYQNYKRQLAEQLKDLNEQTAKFADAVLKAHGNPKDVHFNAEKDAFEVDQPKTAEDKSAPKAADKK